MNSHVDLLLDRKVLGAHVSKYMEIRRGYDDGSTGDDFQKEVQKILFNEPGATTRIVY